MSAPQLTETVVDVGTYAVPLAEDLGVAIAILLVAGLGVLVVWLSWRYLLNLLVRLAITLWVKDKLS